MRPRPTEYRGVRFRSKSEACFAMWLDKRDLCWVYEPKELTLADGYCPDFFVSRYRSPKEGFVCAVIEYKPSKPTDTELERLCSHLAMLANHVPFPKVTACVCVGNFFEKSDVNSYRLHNGRIDPSHGWPGGGDQTWATRQQIGQQRFDLETLSAWKGYLYEQ